MADQKMKPKPVSNQDLAALIAALTKRVTALERTVKLLEAAAIRLGVSP
jgi:hypothetical protein